MSLPLSISILADADVARHAGDVPVYALMRPVVHVAQFSTTTSSLVLDDPRTSQAVILSLWSGVRRERALFELNPSLVDATGEITAPPSRDVVLSAGRPIDVPLALLERFGDWCLRPGWFELGVAYDAVLAAPPLRFGIELHPASLPSLLERALHPDTEPWTRRQALGHLQRLPGGPALTPPRAGETLAEAAVRDAENRTRADPWLASLPERLAQPEVVAFFEREQLRDPPWP